MVGAVDPGIHKADRDSSVGPWARTELIMTQTIEDYRRFYADEIRFVANLNSPALVEAFARVPARSSLALAHGRLDRQK